MKKYSAGRIVRRLAVGIAVAVAAAVALAPGASAAGGPLTAAPDPFVVLASPGVGTVHFTNAGAASVHVVGVAGIFSGPGVPSAVFLGLPITSTCFAAPLLLPGMSCNVDFLLIAAAPSPSHAVIIVDSLSGPSFADVHFGPLGPLGPPPAPVLLAPSPHDFGGVEVGLTSAPFMFTVTNTGASPVALAPSIAPRFSLAGGTCGATLAGGGASCTYGVTYNPGHAGSDFGFLDVTLGGGPLLVHADLSGTGLVFGTAASITPSPAFFPATLVGSSSAPMPLMLTNFGIHTLVFAGSPPVVGPDFGLSGGSCIGLPYILAGGSCTMFATFSPLSSGFKSATFSLAYNGPTVLETLNGSGYTVQPNAGSQGGGYVLVGGPNVEANRDRFEWAVRERADGSVYGKLVTYRFTEGGTRYVARLAIGSIPLGGFSVSGSHATIDGTATLASVSGGIETPVAGSWFLHVESDDLIAGSNNGAGFDRVFIQIGSSGGPFHQTGSPGSPAVITRGSIGNGFPWVA